MEILMGMKERMGGLLAARKRNVREESRVRESVCVLGERRRTDDFRIASVVGARACTFFELESFHFINIVRDLSLAPSNHSG